VASLAGSSLVLTVSQSSADAIVRGLGVAPKRIRPVHEAANVRFNPVASPDDEAVRCQLGIKPGYLLYVGGFDQKKDLLTLVRSLVLVRDIPEMNLLIGGQLSEATDRLLHEAEQLHVQDRLRVLGYVPEESLPALYRGARCFVFPAVAEGFGLPVVEAMACGIPVVAAAAGSLPEVVADGGQLVNPRDPVELGSVLRQLLTDNATHDRWARAARTRAAAFSWERTAQLTEEVLREAAAESPARRWRRRLGRVPRTLARSLFADG
jgi:glycosyltransferase involved in cell wall biosynthesis